MSHLSPSVITDVNGRVTTVHKRVDAPRSALNPMTVPAPAVSVNQPVTRTLLTPPEAITEDESKSLMDWYKSEFSTMYPAASTVEMLTRPIDEETQALLWRVLQGGTVPKEAILWMTHQYQTNRHKHLVLRSGRQNEKQESLREHLRMCLRLVESVGREAPGYASDGGNSYATNISHVIYGSQYIQQKKDDSLPFLLETEEELVALTAVSLYLSDVNDRRSFKHRKIVRFQLPNNMSVDGQYMVNRTLEAFLKENPHEVHRVIEYGKSRDMGNAAKDTKGIIRHLRETKGMSALGEGWL